MRTREAAPPRARMRSADENGPTTAAPALAAPTGAPHDFSNVDVAPASGQAPAGAPGGGAGLGGPGAGAPRLLRVEVVPAHRRHFPRIPGTGTGTHWVGVASATAPKPVVRAVFDPAVSPGDPTVVGLAWSGPDVVASPGNPLEAEVGRMAGRRRVTATLGTDSASTTLWAVFARVNFTAGPTPTFSSTAVRARAGATVDFDATIFPNSLLTAADRPRLDGGNDTPPPGGAHPASGDPLSGGADHHWDFSRKSRTRLINPSAIVLATLVAPGDTHAGNIFANAPWGYPAAWEEGNDDRSTNDENNDPYAGTMTSRDRVNLLLAHAGGADGDTFERRLHFFEFVRLEINRTWWVVSRMIPWRVHQRYRKAAGRWVNDGTDAQPDNAGF